MKQYIKQIINHGDDNGNEMLVKFQLPSGPEIVGLPTKNFYGVHLAHRARELIRQHIERCAAILEILNHRPKTAAEIAQAHYDAKLLEGLGGMMAANEIISHCELLMASGDAAAIDGNRYTAVGNTNFNKYIDSLR